MVKSCKYHMVALNTNVSITHHAAGIIHEDDESMNQWETMTNLMTADQEGTAEQHIQVWSSVFCLTEPLHEHIEWHYVKRDVPCRKTSLQIHTCQTQSREEGIHLYSILVPS